MKQIAHLFSHIFIPFLTLFILLNGTLHAEELSKETTKALLASIDKHAIIYGNGEKKVYVFLDPNCPHSQDFMSTLYENDKMRSMYQYHIFCYELKRFNSHMLIGSIYESPDPLQRLLEVMVAKRQVTPLKHLESKTEAQIGAISECASRIGINKRPYLIIAKKLD